ncbi:BlaI/MecI/CopY family transcriptional regulator [Phaeobacter italicus]|jgi:predicted transcriptional regulator|uniref:Regulatory protein BlaI n=1 Tax=Phaeobacter italicus TaxID=481446 RepID=A0A0H5DFY3_9RHOB|nr:BlaI/MecI/CopY family transcriptional regulator [Phaeobacter italicus]MEC8015274.1 BlaI/MecI/CopY family transcriptional regulator [Pseudomonadota bacterium]NKX41642.1 BlaI/MecI/CopY family transcriptional regulator [Rhodobacteraceae bacterium R_SAG2]MBO9442113.1 BlaI/MecI/CopY family transcriptional regulator [Phaeobacter italicus]MBY5976164.1 BlaI/MecI/CopY family transcriptional regulator [Phaeobacter italicus]MBY6043611.1 BlaI/MecI/CopY family transcriptional regulator [Phaeobacter ital|mmetsp:Transcript_10160/g.12211  ORF Transcript_10160/g.12211 Transcript_10160/m.12211 type:complete len:132 (-) Transcript_10160:156-551(-)
MRKKQDNPLLTEVELEFMTVVWETGGGTVREILAELNKRQERAYTSVATVLKIMEQKGFLTSERADRSLVYRPAVPKADYQKTTLKNLSSKLFNGAPAALVARLVDDEDVTDEMLVEMRALLNERLGDDER